MNACDSPFDFKPIVFFSELEGSKTYAVVLFMSPCRYAASIDMERIALIMHFFML